MTRNARLAMVAAALVVAVAAFVILRPGDDERSDPPAAATQTAPPAGPATTATTPAPPPRPQVRVIRIRDAKPVGGVADLEFAEGDRVRFRVVSDTADEVHVHGFDVVKDVAPGRPVSFDFKATFSGVFDVELEHRGEQIARLEVRP